MPARYGRSTGRSISNETEKLPPESQMKPKLDWDWLTLRH
jgi:hypothetical protein